MRINSLDKFIAKAKEIHGDRYDYSKVVYCRSLEKVTIVCKKHGEFFQRPNGHLEGKGCRKCARELVGSKRKHTTDDFIHLANLKHEGKYDYSETQYGESNTDPVKIICKQHGEFFQKPMGHLAGQGCFLCGVEISRATHLGDTETFIKNARGVHGDKYDYSKSEYKESQKKLVVTCKEHGDFKTTPNSHLRGTGCPDCSKSGFKVNNPAIFYVMRCDNLVKIGITNKNLKQRLHSLSKSCGKDFKVVMTFHSIGQTILDLETKLLKRLRNNHVQPNFVFSGHTETFITNNQSVFFDIFSEMFLVAGELNVEHANI
jgi:hypothetical protein